MVFILSLYLFYSKNHIMAKNTNYLFKLDLLLLSILKEKDKYGYEMIKEISQRTDNLIEAKHGTMYPIIYKLIEEEYITSNTVLVGNKARVYYHLEEKGKEYLESITQDYDNLVQSIDLIVHGTKHYER